MRLEADMMVTWGRSPPPHLLTAASVRRPLLKHMQIVILFAMSAFPPKADVNQAWSELPFISRGCSLTRGLDVKLSVLHLPGPLFSPR